MRTHHGDTRDLFLGFRIALDPRKMVLGLAGLCFGGAGLAAIGWIGAQAGLSGADAELLGRRIGQGELGDSARLAWRGVVHIFCGGGPQSLIPGTAAALALAAFMWWTLVWSFFGGAIARIAAVEVARDERITANEALGFARDRFGSFFWGPMGILVMLGALLGTNALIGLTGKIPFAGDLLMAITYPIVLVLTLVALLLATGATLASPLFAPAMATEATDAFDGVSRSLSYLFSRPWHYLWYGFLAKLYGGVCFGVVAAFGWGVVELSLWSLGLGLHAGQHSTRKIDRLAEYLAGPALQDGPVTMGEYMAEFGGTSVLFLLAVTVCVVLVAGLVAGFGVSIHYSLRTCIYFLLRHNVDATEMDEVWMPEAERGEPAIPPPPADSGPAREPEAPKSE